MTKQSDKTFHIYSDESRHRGERFLLLGGVWVEKTKLSLCYKDIDRLRLENGFINDSKQKIAFSGEFKWTKVSRRYIDVYKQVIDLFFDWIKSDQIRSCIMLVDSYDQNVQAHNNLQKDGFFKLLYQLYYHNSLIPGIYEIFPDRITNPTHKVNLPILKQSLNRAFQTKFASKMNFDDFARIQNFVRNIVPCDSKEFPLIQVLDVVMGAIGYFQNRHFEREGASEVKTDLMKYVVDKLIYSAFVKVEGKKYLIAKSTKFNIWKFRPKEKGTDSSVP